MKIKFWIGTLLIPLVFSLTSCFTYEEVKLKDIKSLKILEFSGEKLKIESQLQLMNPNSYSIKITDSQFDVYIKNEKIGVAKIDSPVKIEANSDEYKKVKISSTIEKGQFNMLTGIVAMSAFGKNEINFKLDGFVKAKAMLIQKKIDIVHEGKVPIEFFQ
jgi:LEA14-like dessication related protein